MGGVHYSAYLKKATYHLNLEKRKIMKKYLLIFFIILIMLPNKALGATENGVLDLSVDPQNVLFDLRNIKPGDTIKQKITVLNNGKENFRYLVSK